MDHLAELMLTLPKVRGLNPVTVEIYIEHVDCWRDENIEKETVPDISIIV